MQTIQLRDRLLSRNWIAGLLAAAMVAVAAPIVVSGIASSTTVSRADAGPDQTITWPQNTARLVGSLPSGTPIWAIVSGPAGARIASPNSFATDVVFPGPGVWTFELKTRGTRTSTSWDRVVVTVAPAGSGSTGSGLQVTAATPTAISLRWPAVSGAVDYRITRDAAQIAVVEDTQLRFRATDLAPGRQYAFAVEALDADGVTIVKVDATATTPGGTGDLTAADLPPADVVRSRALTTFGWSPNPTYDTCSKELHDAFWAFGPDNKAYPTWHPPIYEYANGQVCRFGHEHGQDQRQSTLYATVGPIPFGYVNEQLAPDDPNRQRNEDHVGHKVALFNRLPAYDLASDQEVDCDVLFKLHQGSHSADAFRNPAHERFLNWRCTNGAEVHWKSLHSFGDANSFTQDNDVSGRIEIATSGAFPADQPRGADRRSIPTSAGIASFLNVRDPDGVSSFPDPASGTSNCDNCRGVGGFPAYVPFWNKETWQGGPGFRLVGGESLGYATMFLFGGQPYWNIYNPSRFYDPNGSADPGSANYQLGRQLDLCRTAGSAPYNSLDCQRVRALSQTMDLRWDSPDSPFKGTIRFNEFQNFDLYNPLKMNSRLYSTAYGDVQAFMNIIDNAARTRSAGKPIRQYFSYMPRQSSIVAANWAGTQNCGGRGGSGACWTDFNYYKAKNGTYVDARVHAPN